MTNYLEKILSPQDIKQFSIEQLNELSGEIREKILETVSKVGGHLGGSLGVVELTLALHYCFDSPTDKIIWDVGHQSYAHKLITGRYKQFHTLRQYNGVSGFPDRKESVHDIFGTGHGSTALSAGLGFAIARDIANKKHHVIAVVGDAALGGGLSLEALNHAGHIKKNLIVILNDNEMSISKTVGALSGYLNRIIIDERYDRAKYEVKKVFGRFRRLGKPLARLAKLMEEGVKGFISAGVIFEELGFKYVGPIDGHDFKILINNLNKAKKWEGPVLIHVLTTKGKGYIHAEEDKVWSHGPAPFDLETGEPYTKSEITYSRVFAETLLVAAKTDPKIVTITAAMGEGTGLNIFAEAFPDRFFDVGMCEEHAITMASGLAAEGFRPVVAIYSTFLQRSYDQILHDVCRQKLPVVFAIDRAGVVGEDGETHQGLFDISYLRMIPNIVILAPSDEIKLVMMIKSALKSDCPVAIRYPKEKLNSIPSVEDVGEFNIGKSELLRDGDDAAVLAVGAMVKPALEAASILKEEGINTAVVDVGSVKPLDQEMITLLASRLKKLITVEDNVLTGGFGSAVIELLAEKGIFNVSVCRMGIPDEFVKHGKRSLLLEYYGLCSSGICKEVRKISTKKLHAHK